MNTNDDLLLIGQAPGRGGDPSRPLEGRIGRRLAGLAGVPFEEWLRRTERVNLLDRFPGKVGKGDAWDVGAGRTAAERLRPSLAGRRVVLLGRNVAAAFGLGSVPWLERTEAFGAVVVVLPHPSGIVLWWNDAENRQRASEVLREMLSGEDRR